MGPIWGRQDPGGPHVGHMNFAIWDDMASILYHCSVWWNNCADDIFELNQFIN